MDTVLMLFVYIFVLIIMPVYIVRRFFMGNASEIVDIMFGDNISYKQKQSLDKVALSRFAGIVTALRVAFILLMLVGIDFGIMQLVFISALLKIATLILYLIYCHVFIVNGFHFRKKQD